MIYRRIAQNAPSLGNAGKRVRATIDYTVPVDDWRHDAGAVDIRSAHLAIAAWGIAVFVILAVTAWCML